MRSVWMDCDSGFDDALAVMVLARAPQIELVGISTVVGNTSLDNTTANTLAVAEFCRVDTPIYRGAAKPLAQEPHTIERLLGAGAMGTLGRCFPTAQRTAEPVDAIQALTATLLAAAPKSITILATGPLTNIAIVLLLHPELVEAIDSVVWMGGSTTSGNHTAAAEFNAYADPEALDNVLRSGAALRMFGLNLTRQVLITPDHEHQLRAIGTERAAIVADHVGFYLRMSDPTTPRPAALHDPSAAAYLLWPDLFELAPARVDVELARTISRGATICEFRVPRKADPNALVATTADGEKVMACVMAEIHAHLT
ncbi:MULTISPECIES: nucleoside hydrolase [Nocardia]|uniref:Pyrimidine-specific ribonucleoside hydrolase rihB n=1 Tax=Nocardia africana TaxID=134964 RepID=A0A378X7K1_9NOCA|nr:nucleoside hydrolase [Nocardia africana]MCC3317868.1 nucleoside hydrolase [Nocardia africana]SUA48641.1 Pyrimidine-specific ribonucleoside hydrolase rihB [Nocardia africana]